MAKKIALVFAAVLFTACLVAVQPGPRVPENPESARVRGVAYINNLHRSADALIRSNGP